MSPVCARAAFWSSASARTAGSAYCARTAFTARKKDSSVSVIRTETGLAVQGKARAATSNVAALPAFVLRAGMTPHTDAGPDQSQAEQCEEQQCQPCERKLTDELRPERRRLSAEGVPRRCRHRRESARGRVPHG